MVTRFEWVAGLTLFAFSGCTPAPAPIQSPDTAPPAPRAVTPTAAPTPRSDVTVRVVERPENDRWEVTFALGEPTKSLVFLTKRNAFRAGWTVETSGYAWQTSGGHEVLQTAGEGASEITVSFASDFATKPKDYELNLSFTDGGRLLYLGHLAALPCSGPVCAKVLDGADTTTFGFDLQSDNGRTILADGKRGNAKLAVGPSTMEATSYAYFGGGEPTFTDDVGLVVDPGMPPWMVTQAQAAVPELLAHYKRRMGVALDFKPLVFMSFGGAHKSGQSNGGGVVARVVQLGAEGRGWLEPSAANTARWFRFVAHEVFHLWNGQMYQRGLGVSEEWLSEGSADFYAITASHDLGVISQASMREQLVRAANRCILFAEGEPLATAHLRGDHPNFYTCGAALLFALDQSVRQATDGAHSIDDVVAAMFRSAERDDNRRYSSWDLFRSAVQLSGDPLVARDVVRMLHLGVAEKTGQFFADAFRRAGWPVTVAKVTDATSSPGDLLRAMATKLARCDCGLRRSIRVSGRRIQFYGVPQCQVLTTDFELASVNGAAIAENPSEAFEVTLAAINDRRVLKIKAPDGEKRSIRCDRYRDQSFAGLLRLGAER